MKPVPYAEGLPLATLTHMRAMVRAARRPSSEKRNAHQIVGAEKALQGKLGRHLCDLAAHYNGRALYGKSTCDIGGQSTPGKKLVNALRSVYVEQAPLPDKALVGEHAARFDQSSASQSVGSGNRPAAWAYPYEIDRPRIDRCILEFMNCGPDCWRSGASTIRPAQTGAFLQRHNQGRRPTTNPKSVGWRAVAAGALQACRAQAPVTSAPGSRRCPGRRRCTW